MKPSRIIILGNHRRTAERLEKPRSALRLLGLMLLSSVLVLLVSAGIRYALFSQRFPSLDQFRAYYTDRYEPTSFYARDGGTVLFTLAYDDFESRNLKICETDGEGCLPHRFTEAVRLAREAENQIPIAEKMVRDVYSEMIGNSRFPDLTARLLAAQVLKSFGEEQVLEWYFNHAWFGQMAFGLDAAARLYLDKSGDNLSDAECVLLSAVINAPMLNPIDSGGAVRDSYLQQVEILHSTGLFTDEETEVLSKSNFTIFEPPHYAGGNEPDMITRKALDSVVNLYGREKVERGGMRVVTSEDFALQSYLSCVTSSADFDRRAETCPLTGPFSEAQLRDAVEALRTAPVSIALSDVNNGQLLAALEGGLNKEGLRSYSIMQQAYPIGSTINIFAGLTAFIGGSSPSTVLWDLESRYDAGELAAFGNEEDYQGPIQLRTALAKDHQRALASHLESYATGAVQRNASLFGLTGSQMVSDREILSDGGSDTAESVAYSLVPFAALGMQSGTNVSGAMHSVTVLRVEFSDGSVTEPQPLQRKPLIASNLAYLVHSVFSQESGSLSLDDRPAAVKTGKSSNDDGCWISGYTTEISCAVHLGNPRTVSAFVVDSDRVQGPAEVLWRSVMEFAHRDLPASGWEVPADVSRVKICLPSGKLPTAACQETVTEVFLRGNEPYEYDEYYVEVPVNRQNRMLATRYTPAEDVEMRVFLNLPEEAASWAAENGIEPMPSEYDPIREKTQSRAVQIESPDEFQPFSINSSDQIEIITRLSFSQKPVSHQVSIGKGMYPTEWREVCSGGALENGRWLLCTVDAADFEPGLYTLRTAFTLANSRYYSADAYFEITAQ